MSCATYGCPVAAAGTAAVLSVTRDGLLKSPLPPPPQAVASRLAPMAVATASLYNRFGGVWYVPVGLRAVLRAPLEYACIAAIGIATFVLPWLLFSLIGRAIGLPEIFFLAVVGLPLAASHGVMGALTGHLMRTRPQLFESSAD